MERSPRRMSQTVWSSTVRMFAQLRQIKEVATKLYAKEIEKTSSAENEIDADEIRFLWIGFHSQFEEVRKSFEDKLKVGYPGYKRITSLLLEATMACAALASQTGLNEELEIEYRLAILREFLSKYSGEKKTLRRSEQPRLRSRDKDKKEVTDSDDDDDD